MEQEVRKKEHTVHCFLHRSGMQCNLCETPEVHTHILEWSVFLTIALTSVH